MYKLKKLSSIFLLATIIAGIFAVTFQSNAVTSADAATAACLIYGVQDSGSSDTQFITYNPNTKTAATLGPARAGYDVESLEIHPVTNVLYAVIQGGSLARKLITIDGASGAITPIGDTQTQEIASLAFRKSDYSLWGWDKGNNQLRRISIANGSTTLVYSNSGITNVEAIAWSSNSQLLYFTREDSRSLFAYNDATKAITTITTSLPTYVEGMDTLADGTLLMSTGQGSTTIEMFSYDPVNKIKVANLLIGTTYNDLEGIAYPDTCPNPFFPQTPTPTPTRTPSPSPTRSASPSPTRSASPSPTRSVSPTPTRSASPTPTPSPSPTPPVTPPPDCGTYCTNKTIGNLRTYAFGRDIEQVNPIEINKSYWVKIAVKGQSDTFNPTNGTSVTITERINNANFTISPFSSSTFTLIKLASNGTRTDITSSCGSSCLTQQDGQGFTITIALLPPNDQLLIYFMVTPTTPSTPGQKVPVDKDPDSIIKYGNGSEKNINNTQVEIVSSRPYFETQNGGDVHSQGGLLVDMPGSEKFIKGTTPGILTHSGSAVVRPNNNQLSTKNWRANTYTVNSQKFTYSNMLDTIKNSKEIANLNQITESGFYVHNGDLTITALNNLPNLRNSNMQIVLFVNGNVYIRTSIDIFGNQNSKSSLAIISSKNIGIGTNVNDQTNGVISGIYIADGVIDTACDSVFILNTCDPSRLTVNDSSLTLEGMFLAKSGFNLNRKGKPEVPLPGEKFIYRPELLLTAAPQLGSLSSVWREISP
ncbi:MAG: hypothetical protein M3Q44_06440 [bacterium]|nr:hypothetical protein [bacterium]